MNRQDFLAERRTGIGGSDIHHLFNLEPYGCSRRLFYDKIGAEPEFVIEDEGAIRRGNRLEALIADEYAEKTGRRITEVGLQRHPQHPEMVVHIDRAIEAPERTGTGVLECKTAVRELFYRMKREGLHAGYLLQLQHGMFVTGARWGSFAILHADSWTLLHWDVERDDELCEMVRSEAVSFWARVKTGDAPDLLEADDPRCMRCPYQLQCQGAVMERLYQDAKAERDPALSALVQEYLAAREARDVAKDEFDAVAEQLKAATGDRVAVDTPAGKILFKPNLEWNTTKLEEDLPDVAKQFKCKWDLGALGRARPDLEKDYKRVGTTRPLRVYPPKEK